MKTILGLDVSSTNIGWCLWDGSDPQAFGTIKLKSSDFAQRLCIAETSIDHLITKYQPARVALERPAFGKFGGSDSVGMILQTTGVVRLVLARWDLETSDISPMTAKKLLTGTGKATKHAMIEAASAYFYPNIRVKTKGTGGSVVALAPSGSVLYDEHAADALAVAMAAFSVQAEQVEEEAGVLV